MFELLPLPVTALMPVALFPMMGIMSTNETAMCYMKDTCMLYLGGSCPEVNTFIGINYLCANSS
jgi:hypothetical protein